MDRRGQSTQVGTVLLVATIVMAVAVFAVFLVGAFDARPDEVTHADVRVNVTTTAVSVTNAGGEAIALEDLSVVVAGDGSSTHLAPAGSGQLRPGETWTHAGNLTLAEGARVQVYVTHVPSSNRLFDGTVVVGPPS